MAENNICGERCRICKYSRKMEGVDGTDGIACLYIAITGSRRNCPVDNCDKFQSLSEKEIKRRKGEKKQ